MRTSDALDTQAQQMNSNPSSGRLQEDALSQPPSAGKAKLFGVLGICSHLLLILGAPFAILFGILALVRQGRAKREHAAHPDCYGPPSVTGRITGLLALGLLAVTIPLTGLARALWVQHQVDQLSDPQGWGHIRAVQDMVHRAQTEILRLGLDQKAQASGRPLSAAAAVRTVLAHPDFQAPKARNPYGGTESPYHAGPEPREPGCVALEAVQDHMAPGEVSPRPVVIIRGGLRRVAGPTALVTRVVPLD